MGQEKNEEKKLWPRFGSYVNILINFVNTHHLSCIIDVFLVRLHM